jgi:hypothetical protein
MRFFLTFGQKSPFRQNWVLVLASDYENAREEVERVFGKHWSNLYEESKFDKSYFPSGQVGEALMCR